LTLRAAIARFLRGLDGAGVTVMAVRARATAVTVYNFEVAETHTYFVAAESGGAAVGVHNTCLVGSKTAAEVAGDTNIKPGTQGSVTKKIVNQYARDMLREGGFDWNNMTKFGRLDPIQIARGPVGEMVLMEGHHRFLAAQLTNTPIPMDNTKAVVIQDFPVDWPSMEWILYIWR